MISKLFNKITDFWWYRTYLIRQHTVLARRFAIRTFQFLQSLNEQTAKEMMLDMKHCLITQFIDDNKVSDHQWIAETEEKLFEQYKHGQIKEVKYEVEYLL